MHSPTHPCYTTVSPLLYILYTIHILSKLNPIVHVKNVLYIQHRVYYSYCVYTITTSDLGQTGLFLFPKVAADIRVTAMVYYGKSTQSVSNIIFERSGECMM